MKYNQSKIRITTLHLQDEILDELQRLNHYWFIEDKRHSDGRQMSMSCVLRCLLEVMMPIIEQIDEVRNEDDLILQIRAHII